MLRKLKANDLVGKTIVDVDCEAVNMMLLTFDDETELSIWCTPPVSASAGSVWGFSVEEDK